MKYSFKKFGKGESSNQTMFREIEVKFPEKNIWAHKEHSM
jgi:hypothetical protein